MKTLRKIHTYLGCLFAPMIILFAISGALQLFDLHQGPKDGSYTPSPIVKAISNLHMHQRLSSIRDPESSSQFLRIFMLLMALALIATTIIGIVLALQMPKIRWLVVLCLLAGIFLPGLLIWIGKV